MAPGVDDVLKAYASAQLGRAIDCLAWSGRRRHRGVHQARKSLRRVRATLALAGDALGPDLALVDAGIREVNVSLSELRDAQALVEVLERLARRADAADTQALLASARRTAVARRTGVLRAHLRADPELHGRRARLVELARRLDTLDWAGVTAAQVDSSLEYSARRAAKAGRSAMKGGSDERWHRWRRRVRRLGQQLHALGSDRRRIDRHAKKLAGLLGHAQDLTLLAAHCGRDSPFAADERRALARFARRQGKRARQEIQAHVAHHDRRLRAMDVSLRA